MNRFLLIFLLSFLWYSCQQDTQSSQSNTEVKKILEQAEQAILNHQSMDTDTLMELRMDYYHKAKIFNDSIHQYRSHFYLADFYQSRGIYNEAMSEYEKALQHRSDDTDSARYVQTQVAIATAEIELGNKYKAADILLNAYSIAERNKLTRQLININGNMGVLSLSLNSYGEAKKSFHDAITTIEKEKLIEKDSVDYVEDYINYHMFLAKAYQAEKRSDSAMLYIDRGIVIANHFKDIEGKAYLFELKGKTQIAQGLYAKSYESLQKAQTIFKDFNNDKQVSKIMYLIADYHFKNDEPTEAIKTLDSLETRYNQQQMLLTDFYEALVLKADVYKSIKEFEKESFFRQRAKDFNDSLLASNHEDIVLQTAAQYEIEKIKNKYAALHEKDTNRLYLFLGFAVVAFGVFAFILYRQFSKKKMTISEKVIEQVATEEIAKPQKEIQHTIKSDKTVDELLQKLANLEAQEFYLNPKYNLYATAKKIDTNTTYLSSILNSHKKMTFTEYLNNLRIQYTLDRLEKDKKFRMYTIKAIAKEVGYKSHGSFSRAFKAKTGENPSTYLKKIR
ncbi:helix-turn-helix domain-containing protein [Kordia zhangzhouensis]|uniref:helix-turn-helix domain-containing protein n=1 Tax=Kordia zhangzhouensis TaxID=1620405 RepID=UPI0006296D7D|nr:helix-turn-helix domain-containing protein [Kordia zhangzhouensis]